jgi:hypothetical protein
VASFITPRREALMKFRFPLRTTLGAAVWSLPVIAVACGGRSPLDTEVVAYDSVDASGLQGDDNGGEPGEPGQPAADSGAKPGKLPDAGKDSGSGKDAGVPGIPGIPGIPGLPGLGIDAGPLGACFTCAETTCGMQVTACVSSPTCVQEGFCDLMTCLGGTGTTGGTGLAGLDLACLQKCGTDQTASQELMSALLCVLGSCGSPCLGAITSLGGAGGGLTGLTGLAGH